MKFLLFILFFKLQPAKIVSLSGNLENNRVQLQWRVVDNATADKFEIEKSSDSLQFSMAALVFATDQKEVADYIYYEKVNKKKQFYRVKLINKDGKAEYSAVIGLDPSL